MNYLSLLKKPTMQKLNPITDIKSSIPYIIIPFKTEFVNSINAIPNSIIFKVEIFTFDIIAVIINDINTK